MKTGDFVWARKVITDKDGRSRNGIEETEVMRYERIRADKRRQDSGLETAMAVGRGSASLMVEAVDETFRFVWACRR